MEEQIILKLFQQEEDWWNRGHRDIDREIAAWVDELGYCRRKWTPV